MLRRKSKWIFPGRHLPLNLAVVVVAGEESIAASEEVVIVADEENIVAVVMGNTVVAVAVVVVVVMESIVDVVVEEEEEEEPVVAEEAVTPNLLPSTTSPPFHPWVHEHRPASFCSCSRNCPRLAITSSITTVWSHRSDPRAPHSPVVKSKGLFAPPAPSAPSQHTRKLPPEHSSVSSRQAARQYQTHTTPTRFRNVSHPSKHQSLLMSTPPKKKANLQRHGH